MELLLGLKGFRIQQIDETKAKMPLEIGYTLFIDVTQKPTAWEIKSRDPGNQDNYISTPYCEFKEPEKVHKNATELVTAYQMAMVDRAMGIEGMEVIKPPRSKARSKQAQAVEDQIPEEPVLEEMAEAMEEDPKEEKVKAGTELARDGQKQNIVSNPAGGPQDKNGQDPDNSEEDRAQPEEIPPGPPLTSHHRQPCKLIELQDRDAEPEPQVQKPEYFPEQIIRNLSQDGIVITKNAKGMYQWEITARSDSLNTAIEKALLADKKLREELTGGA